MNKILTKVFVFILVLSWELLSQGWQWVDTGYPYKIFDFSFPPGQSTVGFAVGSNSEFGGDGIVLKTTDGGSSWVKISTDTIPGLKAVYFTSMNVGYAAGFQDFFIKTTNGGSSWEQQSIASKLWYFNHIEFWDANNGITVSFPHDIYRTFDGGLNWTLAVGAKDGVEDLCFADANTLYLAGSDETIYKSTDGGFFWTKIYFGVPLQSFLGVDFYDQNYGLVCGIDGKVLVTTDGGMNWVENNTGGIGMMKGINIFNSQIAYVVGSDEQVFKTTDSGITWFSDFSGAGSVNFYKIKFTENNTGFICGSDGKFLMNTDYVVPVELSSFNARENGADISLTWTTKTELNNSGFEIQRLTHGTDWRKIAFIPGNGSSSEPHDYSFIDENLKSGSYFYRLKQIDLDGSFKYSNNVNAFISLSDKYELEQNYPNPFNPSTTIKFSLPQNTNVILTIYNTVGQKVTELVNKNLNAGKYSINWNACGFASGIYIYELRIDKSLLVKKMLFLK
jgi:photosystem II stability/assembly factor-like uncharacterized protein